MEQSFPHARDLRKGRFFESNHIYHVTTVTRDRIPYFSDFQRARQLITTLRTHHNHGLVESLAFVVMPDHLHWLFKLGEQQTLSQVVAVVKSVSSHHERQALWQGGFHDRAVRREENIAVLARYIVANPLRAGLVTCIGDYPHWDAVWL